MGTHARKANEATVALLTTANDERERPAKVQVGARVGRYLVLEHIGEGAMGMVVRAYDPKLRREVALKLVHSKSKLDDHEARARLLHEAQALARLNDPNVVAVYDADLTEHGVYIAMEYVDGITLRTWLADGPHPWSTVLPILLAVTRGLVAAHAEGIVHRDVKPDNVLIGDRFRVRLTDFGIARASDAATSSAASSADTSDDDPEVVTRAGTVMGTPGYMAPEQHAGKRADARSDQYALCVMAWEALHGGRPFVAGDLKALCEAKRSGPPPRPATAVPEWLHAAIARGLLVDPDARWPSMQALLDALSSGQAHARRRRLVLAAGALATVGAAALGWQGLQERQAIAACEREGTAIAEVWNDAAREKLQAALVATGKSYAESTAQKVTPWIDAQADAWQSAQTEACLDARVRERTSAELLERANLCLDDRRLELAALVQELSRGEPSGAARAVQAAAGLGDVAACRDEEVLERVTPPPAEHRDAVRSIRADLARANTSLRTGAYPEALDVARAAVVQAENVGWRPVVAQARLTFGSALARSSERVHAEIELEAAYVLALRADKPLVAAAAAEELAYLVGYLLARHDDGVRWSQHADALLEGQPDPGGLRRAQHLDHLGAIAFSAGAYEEAKAHDAEALEIRQAELGPDHPGIAPSLNNLANVHSATGAYDEARVLLERALAIWRATLGPAHPTVAAAISNLGGVQQQRGAYREAKALAEEALAIRRAALGPDHSDVADSLNNLAGIALMTGELEEAETLFGQAVAVSERALGPDHPDVARGLYNLSSVSTKLGKHERARDLVQRALAIQTAKLGEDHPDVANSLNSLGNVQASLGEVDAAEATLRRALAVGERALGTEHPNLAYPLLGLAELALMRDEPVDAAALAERAEELRDRSSVPAGDLARARFMLAQALWEADRDRDRALELAARARDGYIDAGPSKATARADVEAWLTEHRVARRNVGRP